MQLSFAIMTFIFFAVALLTDVNTKNGDQIRFIATLSAIVCATVVCVLAFAH